VSSPDDDDEFDNDSTMVGGPTVATVGLRQARCARLEQTRGPGAPRAFDLALPETIVGRSTTAHICIDSSLISRRHMSLQRSGEQFTANDLNSSNGMYLNGIKAHSALLHEGDQLQIGDVVFSFFEGK
jgi:pSer/pThr/pTyr-binding forkhead associated (FHA) protein